MKSIKCPTVNERNSRLVKLIGIKIIDAAFSKRFNRCGQTKQSKRLYFPINAFSYPLNNAPQGRDQMFYYQCFSVYLSLFFFVS